MKSIEVYFFTVDVIFKLVYYEETIPIYIASQFI